MLKKLLSTASVLGMLVQSSTTLAEATAQTGNAFAFSFTAIDGKPMPLSAFSGQALLVVNTASFCGYTKQYDGLQALHQRYAEKGLVVIGVPANDFGAQEPKANADIAAFCQGAFNITFPLTEKQVVAGRDAHPFYAWAREALGANAAPRWNFHKYLVGRDGRLIGAFPAQVSPSDAKLVGAIEAALAAPLSSKAR